MSFRVDICLLPLSIEVRVVILTEALDSDPDIDRDDVVIFRHNFDFFFFPLLALLVSFIFYYQ